MFNRVRTNRTSCSVLVHCPPWPVPSLVGCCAPRLPSASVTVGSTSFRGISAMSRGVVLCSSRISPLGAHMALTFCYNLRLYIRVCSPRGRRHTQSIWGLHCTGRSGLDHSSACTYRLLLVPRTSLPRGVCLRRTVPLLGSHPPPFCSSRSRPVLTF